MLKLFFSIRVIIKNPYNKAISNCCVSILNLCMNSFFFLIVNEKNCKILYQIILKQIELNDIFKLRNKTKLRN